MRERTGWSGGARSASTAALVAAALLVVFFRPMAAQLKPTAPGTRGDPVWQRTVKLSDGRTFVTDGGLAMDAALAKPASLPATALPAATAKIIEGYMAAPLKDEFAITQLTANAGGRTFSAPSGLAVNATYVNFLKRVLPARSLRIRMGSQLEPMVIVSDSKPVGVLMAVAR